MVERWQKDADGILIFVSPRFGICAALYINKNSLGWFIFCRSCCSSCCDRPGLEAKQSGYLFILPREHL
jgi:hypothetical protein